MNSDPLSRNDDDACAKLWEIYVKEAQQYDEGMIKSWKEDMDSMLVFSGLYSAILTAFVIESYHNLQPDPTEDSASLLKRISEQLAASTTNIPLPGATTFVPTTSALTCNILWFISLTIALTCAFLATLVQQWSRRFLHRTSTVRSPGAHAHLLQFLYFGLKDLRMHTVVDLIPSLLHLSLFSFFAGLIAFLHDVNGILMWIATVALSLVLLAYLILTLLPLFKLDSPYATPLSPVSWRLLHTLFQTPLLRLKSIISTIVLWYRSVETTLRCPPPEDMEAQISSPEFKKPGIKEENEAISLNKVPSLEPDWNINDATVKASRVRLPLRESRSIIWTLRSLNDDFELLPFVEAFPDAIQRSEDQPSFREANFHLLRALTESPDPQINFVSRILDMMENAQSSWHSDVHRQRSSIACARALYAIGHVLTANRTDFYSPTQCSPIFTLDMINRIGEGICSRALSSGYGQSALVLCVISSILWIDDALGQRIDDPAVSSNLVHHLLALSNIGWSSNGWTSLTLDDNALELRENKNVTAQAIANVLTTYSVQATESFPEHFVYVSQLMIENRKDSLKDYFDSSRVLWALRYMVRLYPSPHGEAKRCNADRIFSVIIQLPDIRDKFVVGSYIYSYYWAFGWGCDSMLKEPEVLPKIITYLQSIQGDCWPPAYESFYVVALANLIAYTEDKGPNELYLFWGDIYAKIYRDLSDKSDWWIFLAQLIALKASQCFWHKCETPGLLSLHTMIADNVPLDAFGPNTTEVDRHWIILLQSFDCLPQAHLCDILRFFYSLRLQTFDMEGMCKDTYFVTLLARHSEDYGSRLIGGHGPVNPNLLEINGIIWNIWKGLTSLVQISTLDECRVWAKVFSILERIQGALTPEMDRDLREIKENTWRCAILHEIPKDCLDLFSNIRSTKYYLSEFIPLFTPLPEADAEEECHLAVDLPTNVQRQRR